MTAPAEFGAVVAADMASRDQLVADDVSAVNAALATLTTDATSEVNAVSAASDSLLQLLADQPDDVVLGGSPFVTIGGLPLRGCDNYVIAQVAGAFADLCSAMGESDLANTLHNYITAREPVAASPFI